MSPLSFRRAAAADVPALVTLIERAYFGTPGDRSWTHEADMFDGPRTSVAEISRLVAESAYFVMAERDGTLRGCAVIKRQDADIYFGMFAVAPDEQGKGTGRAIIAEVERYGREIGAPRVMIEVVNVRPELVGFYERGGYAKTGRILAFPFEEDPSAAKIPGICLIEMEKRL